MTRALAISAEDSATQFSNSDLEQFFHEPSNLFADDAVSQLFRHAAARDHVNTQIIDRVRFTARFVHITHG